MSNTNSIPNTDSPIEDLIPGLTFQWMMDGQGMVFTAQNSSREVVDAWANKIISICQTWDVDRKMYILNDFSSKDCMVTPYNQEKNRELGRLFPHIQSTMATVVKQDLTMMLARLFVRVLPQSQNIFLSFSRQEAYNWLLKRKARHDAQNQSNSTQ
jgi:hypothetical protein